MRAFLLLAAFLLQDEDPLAAFKKKIDEEKALPAAQRTSTLAALGSVGRK